MMEKFTYTARNGKKITLPRFDNIPFGVIRKLRKEGETEQFFGLIEGVCSAKDLTVIDAMSQAEVREVMTAWQRESAVELGESSAS
ncbi:MULTISPECIES: hypothetical protein [unclassified Nocardia]|uniref:hypothetical protein n=1 Tax=unclassified Nocardia TaxID=2637762 RepID=UPI0024A8224E|nr:MULTISPECIES: hypothetical protein [unclassified Nocardia]